MCSTAKTSELGKKNGKSKKNYTNIARLIEDNVVWQKERQKHWGKKSKKINTSWRSLVFIFCHTNRKHSIKNGSSLLATRSEIAGSNFHEKWNLQFYFPMKLVLLVPFCLVLDSSSIEYCEEMWIEIMWIEISHGKEISTDGWVEKKPISSFLKKLVKNVDEMKPKGLFLTE